MKFKNDIELQAGLEDLSGSTGTSGQLLSSTATGTSWVDQSDISAGNAEHVVVYAKNTHTASIAKGTPVYITGTVGATDTVEIAPADASNSAKMPAVGLLNETLAVNAFGYVITGGFMDNITTDPIDGATPSSNDTVYVKAGGGLTLTKPTGPTGLIQNVAKVGKVSGGNSGSLIVSSILRTNDVPNLTTGKIWVGDGNTVESTVVHLDETNGRMGIGTTSPGVTLQVGDGTTDTTSRFYHNDNTYTEINGYGLFMSRTTSYIRPTIDNTSSLNIGTSSKQWNSISMDASTILFDVNGSESMRINSSGNVGIGTTSPQVKLQVEGSVQASLQGRFKGWYTSGGGLALETGVSGGNGFVLTYDRDNSAYSSTIIESTGIQFVTHASGKFYFTGGNVGIGTTSPGAKLHVDGTAIFDTQTGAQPFYITRDGVANQALKIYVDDSAAVFESIQDETADDYGSFIFKMDGGTTHPYFDIRKGNATQVRFDGSGNVGIGTTAPSQKLHVAGNMRLQNQLYDSTNSTGSNGQVLTKTSAGTIWADNKGLTPTTPGGIVATIVGETIEIAFNQSTTSNIDYYQVWSSDDGGDYGIIGQIAPADFSSTMTVVDTTFVTGGTMSYRVYAVKSGVYSPAGTVSKTYTVGSLSVTDMTVVNLNTAYYIQYEKPISRFIDHVEIYMDSQTTSAALNRSNATIVYSGQNASYMRNVGTSSNFHQFWVEIVTT